MLPVGARPGQDASLCIVAVGAGLFIAANLLPTERAELPYPPLRWLEQG